MSQRREDASMVPITYRDFTAGLFELGHERSVPQNGLLECQDCMPLPSGGLRAAWAWDLEPIEGVPRNSRVVGFQVDRGDVDKLNLAHFYKGLMLATTSTGNVSYTYWSKLSTSTTQLGSTWSSGPTHSSIARAWPTKFVLYQAANGQSWFYNVAQTASTGQGGLFELAGAILASTSSTRLGTAEEAFYVIPHQDRLVQVTTGSGLTNFHLIFTNPSSIAAPPTSNFLDVASYTFGNIVYMSAVYPQDLFVLKQAQGGYLVQGDLGGGPIVRELSIQHSPNLPTWGVRLPQGIAYMTQAEGVWLWAGNEPQHLSRQIVGTPMTEPVLTHVGGSGYGFLGSLGFGNQWLFTPKGYIFDITLNSWFRSTLPGTNLTYSQWSYDEMDHVMYAAGHREPGDEVTIIKASMDQSSMVRSKTFAATLPLLDTQERSIQVRQIEVFGQGFGNGGTWRLEISNDRGQLETTTHPVPARAASIRAITKLDGDWLKIRVLSQGNPDASQSVTQASEAPMIDRIVVWARPKTRRI